MEEEFDEEIACSLGTSSEGDDDRGHKSIASDGTLLHSCILFKWPKITSMSSFLCNFDGFI